MIADIDGVGLLIGIFGSIMALFLGGLICSIVSSGVNQWVNKDERNTKD